MTNTQAILHVLANYANFSGRAGRREYWSWAIARWLILTILPALAVLAAFAGSAGSFLQLSTVFGTVFLATLLPDIAVSVRRLHDGGRSGWWLLWMNLIPGVGFILLLAFMLEGDDTANPFGPTPQAQTGIARS